MPEMPAFPEFDELSGAFGGHIAASAEIPGKHRGRRAGRETIRKPDQTLSKLLTARSASVFMGRAACILKTVRARSARARKGKDFLRNPCKSEKPGKRRREIAGKRFGVFVDSREAAASPAESAGMTVSEEVQYRRPQDGFSPVIALSRFPHLRPERDLSHHAEGDGLLLKGQGKPPRGVPPENHFVPPDTDFK